MCRRPFAAGIGRIDLAGLGRTPQDGAMAAIDCRSWTNTNYRSHASDSSDSGSREPWLHALGLNVIQAGVHVLKTAPVETVVQ